MTINELIHDLQVLADAGNGEAIVIIEEEGEGYAGKLLNVNTLLGIGDETYIVLLGDLMEN